MPVFFEPYTIANNKPIKIVSQNQENTTIKIIPKLTATGQGKKIALKKRKIKAIIRKIIIKLLIFSFDFNTHVRDLVTHIFQNEKF